jgi:hypothetical protein
MQLTINPDELRRGFDAYVLEWERTGKRKLGAFVEFAEDVGVAGNQVCAVLATASDLAPPPVAAALGLPVGSTYARAAEEVLALFIAPFPPPTPEEQAEEEMEVLRMSELIEGINASAPDDEPSLPVVYPKELRRRQ